MRKCWRCGDEGGDELFPKNANRQYNQCLACGRKTAKSHYAENKAQYAQRAPRRRFEARELVIRFKSGPCTDCGRKFHYCQMDFDHRDQIKKRQPISRMSLLSLDTIRAEIAKCDLVCANCHRDRTQQQVNLLPRSKLLDSGSQAALRIAQFVNGLKDGKICSDCKESHPYWRLDWDHREGSGKSNTVSRLKLSKSSEKRILEEIQKCDLVCANCHRLRTWKRQREMRAGPT